MRVVEPSERLPGAIAHELRVAEENRSGPVVGRLLLKLDQQPLQAAQPIVAVVDRPRLSGRRGRVGIGRVSGGLCSLIAKNVDKDVDLAGVKANPDVVGRPKP